MENGLTDMDYFWDGSWQHVIFAADTAENGKTPLIRQLCFGPLETREYGVTRDGEYYYEEHIIEGIGSGDCVLSIISKEELLAALEREIILCEKHAPPLAVLLSERRVSIIRGE